MVRSVESPYLALVSSECFVACCRNAKREKINGEEMICMGSATAARRTQSLASGYQPPPNARRQGVQVRRTTTYMLLLCRQMLRRMR